MGDNETSSYEYPSLALLDIDGEMSLTSILMGIALLICSMPGLIVNIICILLLYKYDFLSDNKSNPNVYRYAFSLLISDTLQLLNLIVYSVPSNIMQKWMFPRSLIRIPGFCVQFNWYVMQLHLDCIAFDRFLAVCKPNWFLYISSYKSSLIAIGVCWTVGTIYTFFLHFLPCCQLYMWWGIYTAAWFPTEPYNYAAIGQVSYNICSSILIVGLYFSVIVALRKNNKRIEGANADDDKSRRDQEARLARQFLAISLFFVGCFGTFEILPYILPAGFAMLWQVVNLLIAFNNSINGFVYLTYNPKFRTAAKALFGRVDSQMVTPATISVKPTTVSRL